jgi:hypothetical protein
MVRFYHGGTSDPTVGGARWLSQQRSFAEGYAQKSNGTLQYVDIPADSPLLKKSFDDSGTNMTAPYINFEAPEDIARNLKPVGEPPRKPPSEPPTTPPTGGDPDKYARPSSVNLDRLNIDDAAKQRIREAADAAAPDLEKVKGRPLTHEEVIEAAQKADILKESKVNRAATLKSEATLLRTRQDLAALAEGKGVSADFIQRLKTVSAEATARGRELNALKIGADAIPESAALKADIVKKLDEIGIETEKIVEAAKDVDFNDAKQVEAFYRKFVKPTFSEIIDEFRYINMLSSPRTHSVNLFSNLLQVAFVRPADRLASGVADAFGASLRGGQREFYVRQVPAYYKGMLNKVGDASAEALEVLKGNRVTNRPDLGKLRTGKLPRPMYVVLDALEASDVFFRKLAEAGEFEALAYKAKRLGQPVNEAAIAKEAAKTAEYTVFRQALDPANETGQGALLSAIDGLTDNIYRLRKVPGVKWFVPFVQTPMNILKQGIEHSPLGFATLKGSTHKTEQIAKAMVGSTVFIGAGALAMNGRTTWAAPTNPKEKAAFYSAGMQAYSVKVGDKWVSYSKLGPLAYPIALAAAMRHYTVDNPEAVTQDASTKAAKVLGGIAEFFADQSYVQGIGDLLDVMRGDEAATGRLAATVPTQLVPLSSLQRWITNIIDPVYRKTERGVSVEAIIQNVKKGIPGLSYDLPAHETIHGEPSPRPLPLVNAVSPVSVSQETKDVETYRRRQKAARERARRRAKNRGEQ